MPFLHLTSKRDFESTQERPSESKIEQPAQSVEDMIMSAQKKRERRKKNKRKGLPAKTKAT